MMLRIEAVLHVLRIVQALQYTLAERDAVLIDVLDKRHPERGKSSIWYMLSICIPRRMCSLSMNLILLLLPTWRF